MRQGLAGAQPSVLLCFPLNVLESHVLSLHCFVLVSVHCVVCGEVDCGEVDSVNPTILGLGAQEDAGGSRRVGGARDWRSVLWTFCVLNCETDTCC